MLSAMLFSSASLGMRKSFVNSFSYVLFLVKERTRDMAKKAKGERGPFSLSLLLNFKLSHEMVAVGVELLGSSTEPFVGRVEQIAECLAHVDGFSQQCWLMAG